jgi:TfoX/Sxy family transcriptional regulator of competence genes
LKWYIEEETKELRQDLEKEILKWPQVDYKKMFGCPCYLVNGKMFAGLVTKGLIITKLNETEKEELQKIKPIRPFIAGKKIIKSWVHLELDHNELKKIMPYVNKSYNRARES